MEIVKAPNAVLSQPASSVPTITKSILDLIRDMKKTLMRASDPEGVGLAAPQVGKSLQLFIIRQSPQAQIKVFINPKINILEEESSKSSGKKKQDGTGQLEGCLSLHNIWGVVKRAPKIEAEYLDEAGKEHVRTFSGFTAVIIQHEYDHLQGILFPKRVLEQNGKLYKSAKDKQGKDIFTEISL